MADRPKLFCPPMILVVSPLLPLRLIPKEMLGKRLRRWPLTGLGRWPAGWRLEISAATAWKVMPRTESLITVDSI